MDISIRPSKLRGDLTCVSSKSYAHRQIISAMLSDEPTEIHINGFSDDIMRTLDAIKSLGAEYIIDNNIVNIIPPKSFSENALVDCGESGTTARIMLPLCAAITKSATVVGRGRLPERPFDDITKVLRERGSFVTDDKLPITVSKGLKPGVFSIAGNVSSQYITGLMFALTKLSEGSVISLTTELKSSAYVDITMDVLKSFGVDVIKQGKDFLVPKADFVSPKTIEAEGDWSNAAFWIVANKLGCDIRLTNLKNDSCQGDKRIMDILNSFEIDVDPSPDLFPILAVLAAGRQGRTTLYNIERLRFKESDRVEAVSCMLTSLGCSVDVFENRVEIFGTGELLGGTVNSYNDHRIVMAAAVASVISKGEIIIQSAEAVNKSYPTFFSEFKRLGGTVNVL